MNQHCRLCGEFDSDIEVSPKLIGGFVYNWPLCPACRESEAEKIERRAPQTEPQLERALPIKFGIDSAHTGSER